MTTQTWMIYIGLAVLGSLVVGYFYYRKKLETKLFDEVFEQSKMIPKQKKNTFLLMIFRDTVANQKKKAKTQSMAKYTNPKYVEAQMLIMKKALNNRANVKDKNMKKALTLLDAYLIWEKKKIS